MKAVLFDLDGTILNTLVDLKNSVNHALIEFNYPERTLNEIRLFIGNGTVKLIERSCPKGTSKDTLETVHECFAAHYGIHYADNTTPYEGIKTLLEKLKNDGYKLAVVSNKGDVYAKKIVNKHYPNLFDIVQGTYKDKPKKPDPYIVDKAINELGVEKKNCIYIGDTDVDVETGNNSKLKTILVTYGYRSKEEVESVYPNQSYVNNSDELYTKIKEILN